MVSDFKIASLHISASGPYSDQLTQPMASLFGGFVDIFKE
jgi:hypothetical protein